MALLKTKFLHPIVSEKTVPRTRLDESLAPKAAQKATFIIAPAGFGKTTLVAHWTDRSQYRTAWLSLDATDNSPSNFLRYLLKALKQIWPSLGEEALRHPLYGIHRSRIPAITY